MIGPDGHCDGLRHRYRDLGERVGERSGGIFQDLGMKNIGVSKDLLI